MNQILPELDWESNEASGNGFGMSLGQQHVSENPSQIAKNMQGVYMTSPHSSKNADLIATMRNLFLTFIQKYC